MDWRRIAIQPVIASIAACAMSATAVAAPASWDGARAMADIQQQLSFGSRAPGMPGHEKTIAMITAEFKRLGADVQSQSWTEQIAGKSTTLTNVVARFDPTNQRRIIVGTHYDSIARAYADLKAPDAPMPGANNSASGVALLLETARALHARAEKLSVGVDFVFFDGEEGPMSLGAGDPDWHALGSPYFASHLERFYPTGKPSGAIIFDMVCYRSMQLTPEKGSLHYAPDAIAKFWTIGRSRAPSYFALGSTPAEIGDDQVALAEAHIPSFLVIGFAYDPWFNTTQDTIDKCSANALSAVGGTLLEYLEGL